MELSFTLGGRRVRMTFGAYPAISLARARTLAEEAAAELAAGRDPRSAQGSGGAGLTVDAVLDAFLIRHVRPNLRSAKLVEAAFKAHVRPRLGARSIYELKRRDVVEMLDAIADAAGPVMADRTLANLRKAFHWQAARDDEFKSPIVRGMARVRPSDRARARVLSDDEIRIVWRTAEGSGAFGRLVKFLLLTGSRRTEASAMTWAELTGGDWTLPAARNKTKVELIRPLSANALAVIGDKPSGSQFVFTDDGERPLRSHGRLKAAFDASCASHNENAPLERWTLHDLRRTARSLMSRAGVASDYAERCLGHVIGGIRGTYDRYEYRDEKAEAYAKLARLVERIVSGRPTALTLVRVEREQAHG